MRLGYTRFSFDGIFYCTIHFVMLGIYWISNSPYILSNNETDRHLPPSIPEGPGRQHHTDLTSFYMLGFCWKGLDNPSRPGPCCTFACRLAGAQPKVPVGKN